MWSAQLTCYIPIWLLLSLFKCYFTIKILLTSIVAISVHLQLTAISLSSFCLEVFSWPWEIMASWTDDLWDERGSQNQWNCVEAMLFSVFQPSYVASGEWHLTRPVLSFCLHIKQHCVIRQSHLMTTWLKPLLFAAVSLSVDHMYTRFTTIVAAVGHWWWSVVN